MSLVKRLAAVFLVSALFAADGVAEDCVTLVVASLGKAAQADADAVVRFAATIDKGSPAGDGLLAALKARPDDGALRIRQILENFVNAPPKAVFEQLSLVRNAEGLDEFVLSLSKGDLDAVGASSVLFYSTNRMNPQDLARFEVDVPGSLKRADGLDRFGNLLEGKGHNWASYSDFIARMSFEDVRTQASVFQQYAQSQGTQLILIFTNAVPPQHEAAFIEILGDLIGKPNVRFVNGL